MRTKIFFFVFLLFCLVPARGTKAATATTDIYTPTIKFSTFSTTEIVVTIVKNFLWPRTLLVAPFYIGILHFSHILHTRRTAPMKGAVRPLTEGTITDAMNSPCELNLTSCGVFHFALIPKRDTSVRVAGVSIFPQVVHIALQEDIPLKHRAKHRLNLFHPLIVRLWMFKAQEKKGRKFFGNLLFSLTKRNGFLHHLNLRHIG